MKNFFTIIILSMFLYACGGQSSGNDIVDTTRIERPDSESIVSMADVMGEDLLRFLNDDDIQSAAALCEEGLDNLMYFRETGDDTSADIYAESLHRFVRKHYDEMEDMATQNYVVKQFMTAVGDSAVLYAKRRRYPQEEEIRNEPNIEAEGPAPSRPAVRHRRKNQYQEMDTGGDDYTTDSKPTAPPATKSTAQRKPQQKAKQQPPQQNRDVARTAKPKPMHNASAQAKPTSRHTAQVVPSASEKKNVGKSSSNSKNVAQDNTTRKKAKGPIVVECKRKTTNKGETASGEATSSQWYLVRPLD